jgi:hypothetical protein
LDGQIKRMEKEYGGRKAGDKDMKERKQMKRG